MLTFCPYCNKEIEDEMTVIWFNHSQEMIFRCDCPICGEEIEVYVVPTFNTSKK